MHNHFADLDDQDVIETKVTYKIQVICKSIPANMSVCKCYVYNHISVKQGHTVEDAEVRGHTQDKCPLICIKLTVEADVLL